MDSGMLGGVRDTWRYLNQSFWIYGRFRSFFSPQKFLTWINTNSVLSGKQYSSRTFLNRTCASGLTELRRCPVGFTRFFGFIPERSSDVRMSSQNTRGTICWIMKIIGETDWGDSNIWNDRCWFLESGKGNIRIFDNAWRTSDFSPTARLSRKPCSRATQRNSGADPGSWFSTNNWK